MSSPSPDPTPPPTPLPPNAALMPDGSVKFCGVLVDPPWPADEGEYPCRLTPGHEGMCEFDV